MSDYNFIYSMEEKHQIYFSFSTSKCTLSKKLNRKSCLIIDVSIRAGWSIIGAKLGVESMSWIEFKMSTS